MNRQDAKPPKNEPPRRKDRKEKTKIKTGSSRINVKVNE
jgi:ribosomal protein S30